MRRLSFNGGWTVGDTVGFMAAFKPDEERAEVTLPHDAMIGAERSAEAASGGATGYHVSGTARFVKAFDAPDDWRGLNVALEFQGVYRDAVVFVNGDFAGQRPSGYATFRVDLNPFLKLGERNEIWVEARAHRDSRWYPGLGIHRDVWLTLAPSTHIAHDGLRIATPEVDDEGALVEIVTTIANTGAATRRVLAAARVFDGPSAVADDPVAESDPSPVMLRPGARETVRHRVYLPAAHRWGVDDPHLYRARVELRDEAGTVLDDDESSFGVRTLQLDPVHGLRINGTSVKLRGACIHHDNGVIGSVAIARAEERRIEILKEAGFNAIRSSHNPASQPLLDACDRLGVLVIDEAFDMWTIGFHPFDYSLSFPEWWERDIEAMVAKDLNHPSVIAYSIGNEIPDLGNPLGSAIGRTMAEKVRSLDSTRYVTHAVSTFMSTIAEVRRREALDSDGPTKEGIPDDMVAERLNGGDLTDLAVSSTEEAHSAVDITAHNYTHAGYEREHPRFPNRVVVGSESFAADIDEIWAIVTRNPYVLGDFAWTGWDYLGEAGLGGTVYSAEPGTKPEGHPYPWLLADSGDIDITGFRRPQSYYREIVFGRRSAPSLAVRRPVESGMHARMLPWGWSDAIASWDWTVPDGTPLVVEVYSASDEVELLLDGVSLGTVPTGPANRYRGTIEVPYARGVLVAIGRSDGAEAGRDELSAPTGDVVVRVVAESANIGTTDGDLAFVTVELVDEAGVRWTSDDRLLTASVDGPGVLQGFGSARPATEERYHTGQHTTFDGRALAVVRPTGKGDIRLTVTGADLASAIVDIRAA